VGGWAGWGVSIDVFETAFEDKEWYEKREREREQERERDGEKKREQGRERERERERWQSACLL